MFASLPLLRRLAPAALLPLLAACAAKAHPAAAPGLPPPPPRAAPNAFTGLSAAALRARFGAPAFQRKDGALEMWRYDADACHAFFFLRGSTVSHVETLPAASGSAADPACLSALRKTS